MHEKNSSFFFILSPFLDGRDPYRAIGSSVSRPNFLLRGDSLHAKKHTFCLGVSELMRHGLWSDCAKGSQTPVCLALASAPSVRDRHDRIKRAMEMHLPNVTDNSPLCSMQPLQISLLYYLPHSVLASVQYSMEYLQYARIPLLPTFSIIQESALGWRRTSSIPGTSHSCNQDTANPFAMSRIRRFPGEIWRDPRALE